MKRHAVAGILLGAILISAGSAMAQAPDDPSAAVLEKARADLAAAQKVHTEQSAAAKAAEGKLREAQQRLLAEEGWAARQAAIKAEASKAAVVKALASKNAQIKAAEKKVTEAMKAAEKAAAENTAAKKALEAVPEEEKEKKAEAKKILEQKEAAAQKANEAVVSAKQAVEKATTEKTAVEKSVAERTAVATETLDAAALAHAKALGGLKPITSQQWDYAKARHLLFRAGFGGTPEEVEKLVKLGPHKAVDYLVEYHKQPRANIEPDRDIYAWERPLAYEDRLHLAARNRLTEVDGKRNVDQHASMVRWWVRRLLETPRPLEEKLVLFWHDHFASSYRSLGEAYLMRQQNQFFRRYADNFDALLHGIVQDPAMIRYLNNDDNVKGNNNENLGRELLELFSLGEENGAAHRPDGYTEKDVRDANTRSMTGATYERYSLQFRFHHDRHDGGPKTLLGKTGNWGTHEAVDIMLQHPATARYVSKKLWQQFAYWEPEPEILDRMAHVLRENGYRIRPMLKNLFLSEQFYSDKAMASHIRSPVELLVGTAKTLKLPKVDYQNIRFLLASMGQSLFDPPSVAGWAEGRDWINTNLLMARYTATANFVKKENADFVKLLKDHTLKDSAEVVDHFAKRCLLTNLSGQKRQALIEFLGPLPPSSEWAKQAKQINEKLKALLVLMVSSPEYQVS
jgi:uncharacterized protein (DUF1800 family)